MDRREDDWHLTTSPLIWIRSSAILKILLRVFVSVIEKTCKAGLTSSRLCFIMGMKMR